MTTIIQIAASHTSEYPSWVESYRIEYFEICWFKLKNNLFLILSEKYENVSEFYVFSGGEG